MGIRKGGRAATVLIVANGWSLGSVSVLSAVNPCKESGLSEA
jgi:hypothetical protein